MKESIQEGRAEGKQGVSGEYVHSNPLNSVKDLGTQRQSDTLSLMQIVTPHSSIAHHLLTRTIINRINFPKREAKRMTRGQCLKSRNRPLLSQEDEAEISQTVALVLVQAGAFYVPLRKATGKDYFSPAVPMTVWFRAFRLCRAVVLRNHLAADNERELDAMTVCDDAGNTLAFDPIAALPDPESQIIFRNRIAGKAKIAMALIRASHNADTSRKRNAGKVGAIHCLRFILSACTGNGLCEADIWESTEARFKAMQRFEQYMTKGIVALNGGLTYTGNAGVPQVFKSFAEM